MTTFVQGPLVALIEPGSRLYVGVGLLALVLYWSIFGQR